MKEFYAKGQPEILSGTVQVAIAVLALTRPDLLGGLARIPGLGWLVLASGIMSLIKGLSRSRKPLVLFDTEHLEISSGLFKGQQRILYKDIRSIQDSASGWSGSLVAIEHAGGSTVKIPRALIAKEQREIFVKELRSHLAPASEAVATGSGRNNP